MARQCPDIRLRAFILKLVQPVLASCFALVGTALAEAQTLANGPHPLDGEIQRIMAEWRVPGLAVAVVKDGRVVIAKGYGVREVGRSEPVDPNTIFGIGSMTKAFTAAAAAMLVDSGYLDWDAPASNYLETLRFRDPWLTAHVTVRDLAAHRFGVDADIPWILHGWSGRETLSRFPFLESVEPYGNFLYSNMGILALGAVVEEASGVEWGRFVEDRIFAPLGMTRSNTREDRYVDSENLALCWLCLPPAGAKIGQDALTGGERNVASPHGVDPEFMAPPGEPRSLQVWPWRFEGSIAPAGAINSTASDIAKWLLFHLNEGQVNHRTLLRARQVREIHSFSIATETAAWRRGGAMTPTEKADMLNGYGLGWRTKIYRGVRASNHSGGQVGYGSIVWLFHDADIGVAVLNNLDYRHSRAHLAIARMLIDYYMKFEPLDWDSRYLRSWSADHEGREIPLPAMDAFDPAWTAALPAYIGTYVNPAAGEMIIDATVDGLVMRVSGSSSMADLRPVGRDAFVAVFRGAER